MILKKTTVLLLGLLLYIGVSYGQTQRFEKIAFILGEWHGTGIGFGNDTSVITTSFQLTMDGMYIAVRNDSQFEPTVANPNGEHHIDNGFISFDKHRNTFVFRQFNNEGYVNHYILNELLSTELMLVFETENIENFVPGGKARWTIKKISATQIETIFDVSFPDKNYTCFGTNTLERND